MEVKKFVLGTVESNCYVVSEDSSCFIVDPGFESPRVIKYIEDNNLKVEFIYITHGHYDHIGGVNQLKELFKAPVYAPKLDEKWMDDGKLNMTGKKVLVDHWVYGGEKIHFKAYGFTVITTPGHSEGSTVLYHYPYLFSGDTLFKGSVGRTDLPGGSFPKLIRSIRDLYLILPADAIVYPGHGENTTLAKEMKDNPFVRN